MNLKSNRSRIVVAILALLAFGLIIASLVVKNEKQQWLLRIPAFILILVLSLVRIFNIGSVWKLTDQKRELQK